MQVSCTHVETCLGCYLTDHHNREGELLLGIVPRSQTEDEAVEELLEEALSSYGEVPAIVTEDMLKAAFEEALEDVDLRWIDSNGERQDKPPSEDEEEFSLELPKAWFVLTWK